MAIKNFPKIELLQLSKKYLESDVIEWYKKPKILVKCKLANGNEYLGLGDTAQEAENHAAKAAVDAIHKAIADAQAETLKQLAIDKEAKNSNPPKAKAKCKKSQPEIID